MKNNSIFKIFILFALSRTVFWLGACSGENSSEKMQSLAVGMEATAVNSLIYIAEETGFFAANGIDVVIKDDYASGAHATERMLKGETDISTAAELAIVRYALDGKAVCTIGSIDTFMHMRLIGRRDKGINRLGDLVGKRIGAPMKTAAEFKLGRFLDLRGIDKRAVAIVDMQASRAADALIDGEIDAAVLWQPYVAAVRDRLGGDGLTIWDVQCGQPMYSLLVARKTWVADHPDLLKRFMKSLLMAEDYLIQNEEPAMAIVRKRLGYTDRYNETIWPEHQYSLRLDQSLVLAMEDQARWMIENGSTSEKNVPDFLNYIYEDALEAVKPSAVFVIR